MADSGVYVYAIVRGIDDADLRDLPGIGGGSLRTLAHGDLRAIVSDVDLDEFGEDGLRRNLEDLGWLEAVARAHDAVARDLAARTATAPLRLATVFLTDEAVLEQLGSWADAAGRALDRIVGRGEWSVKVFVDAQETPPAESPGNVEQRSGTAYLAARRSALSGRARVSEERAALAATVHDQLCSLAVAGRRLMPQDRALSAHSGEMVLNGSYLVDDVAAGEFATAARGLAEGHPEVRVEVAGPWPPYSFASLEDEQ
jgi:hypothetical protein